MAIQNNNPIEDLFSPEPREDTEYNDPHHYEDDRLDALTGNTPSDLDESDTY